jgi:RNA-binding protein 26
LDLLTGVRSSDADADVLADYVLALLQHDGDRKSIRKLCADEIRDFLKEEG